MNKKYLKPTTFVLGIIMLGLLSVSYASAQDKSNYPPIVQKLAQKFNLNEADVQAVFDEEKEEHFADMQARWNERLDDLVNDGKITKGQKDAVLEKHEEMHNSMLELKDLSPEERKSKMKEIHDEFEKWAEEQGIDLPLMGHFKMGFNKGFHKGFRMGLSN